MSFEENVDWRKSPPREICIVMLSALGDAVHVLPIANALKRTWPETRITWVIQPVPYQLVSNHPAIDEFIVFERKRGLLWWQSFQDVAQLLRHRQFDLILGLQVYLKAGILTGLIQSKVKLGFDRARARDMQWPFTNHQIPQHPPQHVQDQYFEFLHYLGVNPEPINWELHLSNIERKQQQEFFSSIGENTCAVVVGTSKHAKNWIASRYVQVLEKVQGKYGLTPVIVGGPSKDERSIANQIIASTRTKIIDALGDDVRKLVWIIDGSTLLISPDTGPLHISHALGTPVVGLFGHTDPSRTGPYRKFRELIVSRFEQRPQQGHMGIRKYQNGMRGITAECVMEKVSLALKRYSSNEPSSNN